MEEQHMVIFRLVSLYIIFFGLFQLFRYKLNIDKNFLPFVTTLSITLVMFIGGLLNILPEMVSLITVTSIISIVWIYYQNRKLIDLNSPGMWFFFIASSIIASILWDNTVFLYDDFSHWTLVIQEILQKDRLPNYADDIITFQAYPTGEAVFAYFFGKILGDSEGVMLVAKAIISLSCISPLFSLIKSNKILNYFIISLFSLVILFSNNGLSSMYVDSLLTLISFGITTILFIAFLDDDINKSIFPLLLANSVLVTMKNSGLFFVLISVSLFIFLKWKKRDASMAFGSFIALSSPFVIRKLWDKHTLYAFQNASESKHSMSLENYQNVSNVKSPEEIASIFSELKDRSLNLDFVDSKLVIVMCCFLIAMIVFRFIIFKERNIKEDISALLAISLLYIIYQIGLLLTYIYSMPTEEALRLASYTRYNITMALYLLGLFLLLFLVKKMESFTRWMSYIFIITLLSVNIHNLNPVINHVVGSNGFTASSRKTFDEVKRSFDYDEDTRIIVYASDRDDLIKSGYLYYQTIYDFRNTQVDIVSKKNVHRISEIVNEYDATLVILKHDTEIVEELQKLGTHSSDKLISFRLGE